MKSLELHTKKTTYEQKQIQRMVNELLIKDKWNLTFIRNGNKQS